MTQVAQIRQLRFVSEGINPHVYDEEGTELPVFSAHIDLIAGEVPKAELVVLMPKVDIVASTTGLKRCPYCGHEEAW